MTTWSPSPGPTAWTSPCLRRTPGRDERHQGSRGPAQLGRDARRRLHTGDLERSTPGVRCGDPGSVRCTAGPRSCSSRPTIRRMAGSRSSSRRRRSLPGASWRSWTPQRSGPPARRFRPNRRSRPCARPCRRSHRDQRSQPCARRRSRVPARRLLPRSPRGLPSSTAADKPSRAVASSRSPRPWTRSRRARARGRRSLRTRRASPTHASARHHRHLCHRVACDRGHGRRRRDGGRARRQPADDPRDRRRRQGGSRGHAHRRPDRRRGPEGRGRLGRLEGAPARGRASVSTRPPAASGRWGTDRCPRRALHPLGRHRAGDPRRDRLAIGPARLRVPTGSCCTPRPRAAMAWRCATGTRRRRPLSPRAPVTRSRCQRASASRRSPSRRLPMTRRRLTRARSASSRSRRTTGSTPPTRASNASGCPISRGATGSSSSSSATSVCGGRRVPRHRRAVARARQAHTVTGHRDSARARSCGSHSRDPSRRGWYLQ